MYNIDMHTARHEDIWKDRNTVTQPTNTKFVQESQNELRHGESRSSQGFDI
jgi:hypothetical protein